MYELIRKHQTPVFLAFCVVALIGCASQPSPDAFNPPGFLMGIVHGFFIVFSLT